jgi:REP element-mobilizing transposase RayT
LFYEWFDILSQKGNAITAYVIMPNHFHGIVYYGGGSGSLNSVIGSGKRFIGYEIIGRLVAGRELSIVEELSLAVQPAQMLRGKLHEIWQDAFDVKECRTEQFLLQKLNYLHNNPCVGKWKLVKEPHHYLHSSASFYFNGRLSYPKLRDFRDFIGMYKATD